MICFRKMIHLQDKIVQDFFQLVLETYENVWRGRRISSLFHCLLHLSQNISSQLMSPPPATYLSEKVCLNLPGNFLTDTRRWLLGPPVPSLFQAEQDPFFSLSSQSKCSCCWPGWGPSTEFASVYLHLSCTRVSCKPMHGSLGIV